MNVRSQPAQVEYRVAHQLARPVKGHVAPPATAPDLHASPLELCPVDQQVPRIAASSQRDHRRVFQQQQRIGDLTGAAGGYEGILQLLRL
jgi:hypothetical protein